MWWYFFSSGDLESGGGKLLRTHGKIRNITASAMKKEPSPPYMMATNWNKNQSDQQQQLTANPIMKS